MGGRNLLRANAHTIEDRFAGPDPSWTVHLFNHLLPSLVPWVEKESVGFRQHGGSEKLSVEFEGRTAPETDSTKDAVDVWINLLPLFLVHQGFPGGRELLRMEERLDLSVAGKERRHIDDEVSDHRETGEGFDEDGPALKIFDMRSARQDHLPIHPHGAGPANGPPAGISKSETPVLFILDAQQGLQEIHLLPRFEWVGLNP